MLLNKNNVTVLILSLVFTITASAYEQDTHRELSTVTVDSSILAAPANNILSDFGLSADIGKLGGSQIFPNSEGQQKTIIQLIEDGADFEDKLSLTLPRPLHHFYDPINDLSLQHPLLNLAGGTHASPDWALEEAGELNGQDNSYKNAVDAFFQALTLPTKTERDQQWGIMFESLGNVIHHIQDMAQPEHVRNDLHCGEFWGCELPGAFIGIYDPSLFELRSKRVFRDGIPANLTNYTNVTFPTAREFWTTRASAPAVADRRGLADFTNRNFVSKDTNFEIKNGTLAPSSRYSLPVPSGTNLVDLTTLEGDGAGICQRLNQNGPADLPPNSPCEVEFIKNIVTDSYDPIKSGTNNRAASLSLFDQYLTEYNVNGMLVEDGDTFHVMDVNRLLTINEYNIDATHEFLIPRAVAYSAGLIDHFFRGKIDMLPNPNGAGWVIKNLSSEDMEGTFALYYDSNQAVNGQQVMLRAPIPGASWPSIIIPPNSEVVVGDYTVPSGLISKTLVFSGRIGVENNVHAAKKIGGWTGPIFLGQHMATGADVAVNDSGNAAVAYTVYDRRSRTSKLWSQYYTPAGGWSGATLIDNVNVQIFPPSIAMDAYGNAMVIYSAPDSTMQMYNLWSQSYTPAGGWGGKMLIDSSIIWRSYRTPSLAMDATGNAMLAYRTIDTNDTQSVWVRKYTSDGGWSNATLIDSATEAGTTVNGNGAVSLAMNDTGDNAMITYWLCTFCDSTLQMSSRFYTPTGGWGLTTVFDRGGITVEPAIDGNGNAVVVFTEYNSASQALELWSRFYTPAAGWGSDTLIDGAVNSAYEHHVAMDTNGNAIVNYKNTGNAVVVRHYYPGTGWGQEIELSVVDFDPHSIDVSNAGNAVVLSDDSIGMLYANHYTR